MARAGVMQFVSRKTMHFSGESIQAMSWWLDEMMWRLPGAATGLRGEVFFWAFTGSSVVPPVAAAAKSAAERVRKAMRAIIPGRGFSICILSS
jgi:hypothetical protein